MLNESEEDNNPLLLGNMNGRNGKGGRDLILQSSFKEAVLQFEEFK